ncbi:hypothetical protein BS47DRAFT_1400468 [Hydnum rufescens UP504]|uniref:Uncharacterized protein n=1 Tax=Hydnum rufescens UP504 TaxID=1448309 RepID=A0A9P6AGB1_9AGAM|nr:hypothetical protein BS47DRAFT_1400468 [Hydnum rufescens UP504]
MSRNPTDALASKKPSCKLQAPYPMKTAPVSMLTTAAQSAANAICYIPHTDTEIGADVNTLLEVIKRIDSVSADLYCKEVGDEKMLAQLEDLSGTLWCRLSIVHHLWDCDKEVYVFTQDLKMALDQFHTAALPMYTTSTIEMMVLCLGIKEEFSRFLNAVVSHKHRSPPRHCQKHITL